MKKHADALVPFDSEMIPPADMRVTSRIMLGHCRGDLRILDQHPESNFSWLITLNIMVPRSPPSVDT